MNKNKKDCKVLIIIPSYNEELNIKNTVDRLKKVIATSKYNIDYIVINDGSTDNTSRVCFDNNFNTINLIENLGIGGCVQTGYKYALKNNFDVAIQFDGDGQHDENYIDKLIDSIYAGNDFVIGSRFVKKLSKFTSTASRKLGIKIISGIIKVFTGKTIYDTTSGFRAANRKVIEIFCKDYPQEYPEPESTVNLICKNLKIDEIPVNMYEREHGKSSIYLHKNVYYMISVCLSIIIRSIKSRRIK